MKIASALRVLCLPRSSDAVNKMKLKRNHFSKSVDKAVEDILSFRNFSSISGTALEKEIQLYASKKLTPVSLKSLMETGKGEKLQHFDEMMKLKYNNSSQPVPQAAQRIFIQVACFLHRELPIRLAQRATKLEGSPLFARSEHIKQVAGWYKSSFSQIRACPVPNDPEKEAIFAKVIESVYERHSATLITMAKGAHELRNMLKQDINAFADFYDIQKRLDEFYVSRIGIRMLIGQYLALRSPSGEQDMIGLIALKASPVEIAKQAIQDAAYMCRRAHGDSPEVHIHGRTDLTFAYVSSHISYILMELLKNSMRATIEKHGVDKTPPIKLIIADSESNEDVVIKVSDEGGGISRSNMNRIWSYLYTTADASVLESMIGEGSDDLRDFGTATPLAGLGYGLPIARCYARCFEGELTVMSMEGYGTDSYIYLPRLGTKDTSV